MGGNICEHDSDNEVSGPCPICNPPVRILTQANSLTVAEPPLMQQQLEELASDAWHIDVNAGGGIVIKIGGTNKVLKIESIEGQGTFLRIYSEGNCIFEEKLLDEEADWESFLTSKLNDEIQKINDELSKLKEELAELETSGTSNDIKYRRYVENKYISVSLAMSERQEKIKSLEARLAELNNLNIN